MSLEAISVTPKRRNDILYYLSKTSSSAAERLERLEALYKSLRERISRNPLLEKILGKAVSLISIPEPPFLLEAERTAQSLEEYSSRIQGIISTIEEALRKIDQVEKLLGEVEKSKQTLEKWAEVFRTVNTSLYSDIVRAVHRADKILQEDYSDISGLCEKIEGLNEQLYHLTVKARTEYNKAVSILLGEVSTTWEVLLRADAVASLQDKAELELAKSRLKQIEEYLLRAKLDPQPVDSNTIYKELSKMRSSAQALLNTALSELEVKVYEETLRFSNILGRRPAPLTELVDYVSRKTSTPAIEVLKTIYQLSSRGLLTIKVIISS
ncbi:MAG: hypothetical protein LM590_08485 [Thermofilum sp.]|jgi:hypothetical protein|nr:hypothetical protein [Thermofilum sp.]